MDKTSQDEFSVNKGTVQLFVQLKGHGRLAYVHNETVCSADNVALLAFAARRRRLLQQSIDISCPPRRCGYGSKGSCCETDRRTDRHTDGHRTVTWTLPHTMPTVPIKVDNFYDSNVLLSPLIKYSFHSSQDRSSRT